MHRLADAPKDPKPDSLAGLKKIEDWASSNKVCHHTMISTLFNELFDVYCS